MNDGGEMLLDWFDASEAVSYAEGLVGKINALKESGSGKGWRPEKSEKALTEKFEKLINDARIFAKGRRLNVYKKAKFLNAVKWGLRETGNDDAFVDKVVSVLTVAING